jgi:hypothetical protein
MVLWQFFWYLRTIGLRISPYQKLSKVHGENLAHLCLQIIVMKKGSENDQTYMYRFVRYLSTFFYTYLPINNHFQLIIITNVSFVTSPTYFVSHLATPVVSFLIFPIITLFIYKPQIHVFGLFTFYRRCFLAVLEGNESLDLVCIYFSTYNLNK